MNRRRERLRSRGVLLTIAAVAPGCGDIDRTIPPADAGLLQALVDYQGMRPEHRLTLVDDTEPGQRLIVLARLLRSEDGQPLPHRSLTVYQADRRGDYNEAVPGVESSARLNGAVRTDSLGRFLISTVLPGDYGSTPDNRHIHTSVTGARPEAYDFYFRQFANRGLRRWAERSDQAVLLDLRRTDRGVLLATTDFPVRGVPDATGR